MDCEQAFSPIRVILIFILIALIGISMVRFVTIQPGPSKMAPTLSVFFSMKNASPQIIEQEVTDKLESALCQIQGIKNLESTSSQGRGQIKIRFDKSSDMARARLEAVTLIRQIYKGLIPGVSYPIVSINQDEQNEQKEALIAFTLTCNEKMRGIEANTIEKIQMALLDVKGVGSIEVYSGVSDYFQIVFDPQKWNALNLNPDYVAQMLRIRFSEHYIGLAKINDSNYKKKSFSIICKNNNESLKNFQLSLNGYRTVYLKDIANIVKVDREPDTYFRVNGQNTISIFVYSDAEVNQIKLADQILKTADKIQNELPEGYLLIKLYNSIDHINKELRKILWRSIFTVVILFVFVFIVTLRYFYLLLIAISLIVNICLGFLFYYLFEVEIQVYSLVGITISVDIVINSSIVMIDHYRLKRDRRVFIALLSSALVIIASLSFIFFLDDRLKENLTDFAIIIIINISVSLAVTLYLLPALMELKPALKFAIKKQFFILSFIKHRRIKARLSLFYVKLLRYLCFRKRLVFTLAVFVFGIPVFLLPTQIKGNCWYINLYNKTLGNSIYSENIRTWVDRAFGGSLRLFSAYVFENSHYNTEEKLTLYIRAMMPDGSTLNQINETFKSVEKYLMQFAQISKFETTIYSSQNGQISINFKDESKYSSFPVELYSKLIALTAKLDGIEWNISIPINDQGFNNYKGSDLSQRFQIKVTGFNYIDLTRIAENLKFKLLKHSRIEKVQIVSKPSFFYRNKYEYYFDLDHEKISKHYFSMKKISQQLQNESVNANLLAVGLINGKYERIYFRSLNENKNDRWTLQNNIFPAGSNQAKLTYFTNIHKEKAIESIERENQQYILYVCFEYYGSLKSGKNYLKQVLNDMKQDIPLGYAADYQNDYFSINSKETKKQIGLILLIITIIYFICSILFESLILPLAVITLIPFSFIGVFLTFYVFDINFDQGGYAAMVLLTGLTVSSGLYIINDYNNLKKRFQGRKISVSRLYMKAFQQKIRPVLLTKFSTSLGLIPFLIGGQNEVFWFAFAAGIMGGLAFSLIGVFFYLPLFFVRKDQINA
jgi:multidrug efflux pump subunit AcrB